MGRGQGPLPKVGRAAVLNGPHQPLEMRDVPVPSPDHGQVLLKVRACGICHSDLNLFNGVFPHARFPTVPGHEIVAEVVDLGPGVDWPEVGVRVGLPYLFSGCNHCEVCTRGDEILCPNLQITGITVKGGYQEYMLAPAEYVSRLPERFEDLQAAPLMCAGVTSFNGLRRAGAEAGDRVAIIGSGSVGHLSARFAEAMGARVCVVVENRAKESEVPEGVAEHVIAGDEVDDLGAALSEWGGADVIINAAPTTTVANAAFTGLRPDGTLMLLGYSHAEPVQVKPLGMLIHRTRIMGMPSGSRQDLRDTLEFAASHDIVPEVRPIALEEAEEVWRRMETGTTEGYSVISFGSET